MYLPEEKWYGVRPEMICTVANLVNKAFQVFQDNLLPGLHRAVSRKSRNLYDFVGHHR